MHVCLKKLAARKAPSLTAWQVLQHLRKFVLVDVEFETSDGRSLTLPEQPPPRVSSQQMPKQEGPTFVWPTWARS